MKEPRGATHSVAKRQFAERTYTGNQDAAEGIYVTSEFKRHDPTERYAANETWTGRSEIVGDPLGVRVDRVRWLMIRPRWHEKIGKHRLLRCQQPVVSHHARQ